MKNSNCAINNSNGVRVFFSKTLSDLLNLRP